MFGKKRKAHKRGVLICGAYGSGNAGDDAILEAIVQEMREIDPDIPIWALSRTPKETRVRFGIGAVHIFNPFAFLSVMRKTLLYISGGGNLIQDVTSRHSLWYYLGSIALAKLSGNLVAMYGCGIGPVRYSYDRRLTRFVLERFVDVITLREDSSLEELKRIGVGRPEIVLASDPVLALSAAPEENIRSLLHGANMVSEGQYICFALRNWKGFAAKVRIFADAAERAYHEYGLTPVFVAINHQDDGAALDAVVRLLNVPYHVMREPLTSGSAIGFMSHMSVVVAMRLHGLIFAASQGVPLVGIDYDPKVTAFLRYAGQEMYIPFQDMDLPTLNNRITEAVRLRCDREKLAENVRRLALLERRNVEAARRLYCSVQEPQSVPLPEGVKRIAIFQSDLRVGGIQKALHNILSGLDYSRCYVDLFLFERGHFFALEERPGLRVHYLKPYPYINRFVYFSLIRKLAKPPAMKDSYDVAVDFSSYRNECAVGALGLNAAKRVMWIHNDVEVKLRHEIKYRILWHFFRKKLAHYDSFCAVSPGIIEGFRCVTGILDKPVTAISNFIDTDEIFRKSREEVSFRTDPSCYNLCTMGRICHQKGFDILLELLAPVAAKRPDLRLYLLGDGPDRDKLEAQITRLRLGSVVTLLGNRPNPFPYLRQMDGFALTSRYEGQGIVIWEAKALGLELFIAKNLERYNPGVQGIENLAEALLHAQRREKKEDPLEDYNRRIRDNLYGVFGL